MFWWYLHINWKNWERVKKTDRNVYNDNRNQRNYKNNMNKHFCGHKAYLYDSFIFHVLHSTYEGSGLRFKSKQCRSSFINNNNRHSGTKFNKIELNAIYRLHYVRFFTSILSLLLLSLNGVISSISQVFFDWLFVSLVVFVYFFLSCRYTRFCVMPLH